MIGIHRPIQMAPLWVQASAVTGMPVEPMIWANDPPASSWPACLAVNAAGLQSPAAGDLYLRQVRRALMLEGRNVARNEVLVELAGELAKARPDFDSARFVDELPVPKRRRHFNKMGVKPDSRRGAVSLPLLVPPSYKSGLDCWLAALAGAAGTSARLRARTRSGADATWPRGLCILLGRGCRARG